MHFVTGFPGFLASAFLPRLLSRTQGEVVCLVQPRYAALAAERLAALIAGDERARRVRLIQGDLTEPMLGLDPRTFREVETAYHFAAVYDLAVGADLAQRVNVDGTRHVVDALRRSERLARLHYVSTLFVSGRYDGLFSETDLNVGQRFNNHYESTKHQAELVVRAAMDAGLPATIYRPAIVVGDSQTGATQKMDGPYYIIKWLLRFARLGIAPVPLPLRPSRYQLALAPHDYVLDALDTLAAQPDTSGQTFHLVDAHPPSIPDVLELFAEAASVRAVGIPAPIQLVRSALQALPTVRSWIGIEPETFAYFTHPTRYASGATQHALASAGVTCPPFASYAANLVRFTRAHPDLSSAAMA